MKSMLFGYTKREDGLYEKIVHFGKKGTGAETLVRDSSGNLKAVIRNAGHRARSKTLSGRAWTESQRRARINQAQPAQTRQTGQKV